MNKIFLVARREFLSRVQKKTFLLTTILVPLLIFVFYAMIIYFSVKTSDDLKIAIADEANVLQGKPDSQDDINFELVTHQTATSLNAAMEQKKYTGYIIIPAGYNLMSNEPLQLKSSKTIGLMTREKIQKSFSALLEQRRLLSLHISKTQLDSIQADNNRITFATPDGKSDTDSKAGISYAVGYISGFFIYIILFIYGTMVMRGVMEEKMNRIAEVIVSSVKPFQLMMGKITGIGAVGLIQFIIWIVLVFGLQLLLPLIFPGLLHQMQGQPIQPGGMQAAQAIKDSDLNELMRGLRQVNFSLIIGCFIFYFLGGYLLYSSLFAAVGSAVNEDPQDAQSLSLPVTMPIIFSMVIMFKAVNEPNSGLAVFGSLFPLTSPVVMMARVAHGIPEGVTLWELLLSMALLIAGFMGTTWLAAKIYRTGILLYGKKVTWKEMWKWAVRSN
jgi:ABC-2 type transport system permease protein